MADCDSSTIDGSPSGRPNRSSLDNDLNRNDRHWRLWPLFLVAAAIGTAALAVVAIAIASKAEKCAGRDLFKDVNKETAELRATRTLRLIGAECESNGGVRIHLSTGESVMVDSASVELRSATGQLLQQIALPLLPPSPAKIALHFQQGSNLTQRQLLGSFPDQRRLLIEQLQLRQLQKQAELLQIARAAAAQRQIPLISPPPPAIIPSGESLTEPIKPEPVVLKRRLHARRVNNEKEVSASKNAAGDESKSEQQTSNENDVPVWNLAKSTQRGGVCQAALGGEGASSQSAAEGGSTPTASSSAVAILTENMETTHTTENLDDQTLTPVNHSTTPVSAAANGTLSEVRVHRKPVQVTSRRMLESAPKRNLMATQTVAGMAVVLDSINRVGQAMFAGPLAFAQTMDAAGALFASPTPPLVNAPLHVGNLNAYLPSLGVVTAPYTFACSALDPNCLYRSVGVY